MTRRNIIRFWRGARRHPKWDLGTPPNPRARKSWTRRARRRGGQWPWVFGTLVVLLVLSVPALDLVSQAWRQSDGCRVTGVIDGDTLRLNCPELGAVRGRILGLDTAETRARCWAERRKAWEATAWLHWRLWAARETRTFLRGEDRYGRQLVRLWIDGENVAEAMIAADLARGYAGGTRRSWCS